MRRGSRGATDTRTTLYRKESTEWAASKAAPWRFICLKSKKSQLLPVSQALRMRWPVNGTIKANPTVLFERVCWALAVATQIVKSWTTTTNASARRISSPPSREPGVTRKGPGRPARSVFQPVNITSSALEAIYIRVGRTRCALQETRQSQM